MNKPGTLKKLSLVLFLIVLLPAIFYSGYELSSLSTTENLMASIYNQQLDVILFSLNQYALDVGNNWASRFNLLFIDNRNSTSDKLEASIAAYLDKNPAILAIALSDSAAGSAKFFPNRSGISGAAIDEATIIAGLKQHTDKIERLLRFQRVDYRKIEPIQLSAGTSNQHLALTFVAEISGENPLIVTMVLDENVFIRDIFSNKLLEAAGDQFILAVFKNGVDKPLFATSPLTKENIKQKKELWLFPDIMLGIRPAGETIDELVQSRFARNLTLIVVMDLVIAIGAWIVYRNMRKEMELVKLKSDFVSNVSHELRTPLSLIQMFAETLEMGRLATEEKKQEYYTTILRETERLTRLVNNILNFSRMEAGKKEFHFALTDVNGIISRVLDTYMLRLQSEGFDPVVELDPDVPDVSIDPEAINEAIINVLDNAIKYSNSKKFLSVRTGKSDRSVIIEIEDHGIGISHADQEKIFETFYRVSSGLVHNTKGSGLGLTIVKHIMEAHGGRVTLNSSPGKGSTFRLVLPFLQRTSS